MYLGGLLARWSGEFTLSGIWGGGGVRAETNGGRAREEGPSGRTSEKRPGVLPCAWLIGKPPHSTDDRVKVQGGKGCAQGRQGQGVACKPSKTPGAVLSGFTLTCLEFCSSAGGVRGRQAGGGERGAEGCRAPGRCGGVTVLEEEPPEWMPLGSQGSVGS